jgi:hypothetical protein
VLAAGLACVSARSHRSNRIENHWAAEKQVEELVAACKCQYVGVRKATYYYPAAGWQMSCNHGLVGA